MPVYCYKCKECGYLLEVKQSFSEDSIDECPECQEKSFNRVIGNVYVHYKGPGFYTTESRGITGKKRKPNIKVGLTSELSQEEQERAKG